MKYHVIVIKKGTTINASYDVNADTEDLAIKQAFALFQEEINTVSDTDIEHICELDKEGKPLG